MSWRLNSPAIGLFIKQLVQADTKGNTKDLHYQHFIRGIHRWRPEESLEFRCKDVDIFNGETSNGIFKRGPGKDVVMFNHNFNEPAKMVPPPQPPHTQSPKYVLCISPHAVLSWWVSNFVVIPCREWNYCEISFPLQIHVQKKNRWWHGSLS